MTDRICPACEATFTPASNHQKWCGRTCYNRERQRRYLKINPRALTRSCGYCGEMFSSPDDRRSYCTDECTRTAKSLREAYRRYGITMAQYRALWLSQKGVCAICRRPERTARNRLLTIDHDHVSGHVRGLLCSQCNQAIGLLDDSPKIIEAAALYVKRTRQMKLFIA
jgi:hypothetical protein